VAGEPDALIGSVIDGRYEVRGKLGHGGMGRLYRAWQASVSREVAIKMIDRSLVTDPMAVTRFQREAELASKLSHPNTVSVFDFGRTSDGQLYIAMELIAGKTLTAALREAGAFAVSRIVLIGIQLCNALERAHGMGIVHRDLKLDNVMVLERDLVKILDFGLAKRLDDMRGTAAGIVVGTPRYIAPEVSTSGVATPASDMYAVGMILTELAIGGPLWGGDSLGQLLAKKLDPQPAIQQVPSGLRAVTRALLDASPERRPTATQAHELLIRLARGEVINEVAATTVSLRPSAPTVRERPVVRPRTRRRWVVAAALGSAAIASVIAVMATREHDRKHPETVGSGAAPKAVAPVAPAAAPDPWSAGGNNVTVHVVSFPPGATISDGHDSRGKAPVDLALPSGSDPVWIGASLGDVHGGRFVVPDHNQTLRIVVPRDAWLRGTCPACLPSGISETVEVTLRIRGPLAVGHVRVEGQDFGTPPFDLQVRKGTAKATVVAGAHSLTVVADHNQTVLIDSCDDCVE
jgi:serine/threonine-protein kinase